MTSLKASTQDASKDTLLWHEQDIATCFQNLGSSERGLNPTDAVRRLRVHGPNALPSPKPTPSTVIFLRQFQSPLIYILLIASIIVFFLGDKTDSIIILAVLLINALVGIFQEGKAQNTLLALRTFTKTEATILRAGAEIVLSDSEIVPGDVLVLREGDKVPADARLFEITNFKLDESALTGESEPVIKITDPVSSKANNPADKKNIAFKGTFVLSGHALAIVVATGLDTFIGSISKKIVTIDTDVPLKENIKSLSRVISVGVLLVSSTVFFIGVLYGNTMRDMFFTAVAVAVSLIPEGLPIVITLILATGAYRMAKQNALIKKLAAVEALGQATVIAVDKTGTITRNELMVESVYVDGKLFEVHGNGYEPKGNIFEQGESIDPSNHKELLFAGKVATLCANATVSLKEKEGVWRVAGDPTEAALLVFGEKIGFSKENLENEEPQIGEYPFDSKRKYHVTLHKAKRKFLMTVVGAPEVVMSLGTTFWSGGRVKALKKEVREKIEETVHAMSRSGLRVLAFSYAQLPSSEVDFQTIEGLTFGGLYGMRDVLRENVGMAVDEAKRNGVRTVMITGDHKITAESIAKEAHIFKPGDIVLTGNDLEELNDLELVKKLEKATVFARVSPENKLRIIELFKKRGDIIAMTGDGVNDALSLVAADLGIAMGKIGTEVSKEAADIVLLDDNFKSIVSALEEGRSIFQTIKKVIMYLFSTGLGELFTIVLAMLLLLPLPLLPTQILWLNLVTDGFLVVALAFEPREKLKGKILSERSKHFFDGLTIFRMFLMSFVMTAGTLALFAYFTDVHPAKAGTIALTVLAVYQWFNAWNCRSETESIFSRNFFSNYYLILATLVVILLQVFAIYNPVMNVILHTTALSFHELVLVVSVALTIVFIEELRKLLVKAFRK